MRLHEYQQKILELDAEIANRTVERDKLRIEAVEKHYPEYKRGTKVKYKYYSDKLKCGLIISAELDKRNPFKVIVTIRPTKNDFTAIGRIVVHPVNVRSEDVTIVDDSK